MKKQFPVRFFALFLIGIFIICPFSIAQAFENPFKNKLISGIEFPTLSDVPELPTLLPILKEVVAVNAEPAAQAGMVLRGIKDDFSRDIITPISQLPKDFIVTVSIPLRRTADVTASAVNLVGLKINSVSSVVSKSTNNATVAVNYAAAGSNGFVSNLWDKITSFFGADSSSTNFSTTSVQKVLVVEKENNTSNTNTANNNQSNNVVQKVVVAGTSNSFLLQTIAALTLRINELERRPSAVVNNYVSQQTDSIGDSINRLITSNNTNITNTIVNSIAGTDQSAIAITGGTITGVNATTTDLNIEGNLTLDSLSGSSGQVLTSNGTGTTPTWENIPSTLSTTSVRALFSATSPLAYDNTTGVFDVASGYNIPLTASTTEWANKVSSQWTTSGSNISYMAGNIGIGTTTSASKLTVNGNIDIGTTTTSSAGQVTQNGSRMLHTYGTSNLFVGENAGNFSLTVGNATEETGIGKNALAALTTGIGNTALGANAGASITTGQWNVAIGRGSATSLTTGSGNMAIGRSSMYQNVDSSSNTAVGDLGFFSLTGGDGYNTAIGYQSMFNLSTGSSNVAIGASAGNTLTTGTNNVFIGNSADATSATLTNAVAIGYQAKVAASNSLILGGTGSYSVNVGIGTTTPNSKLTVVGGNIEISTSSSGIGAITQAGVNLLHTYGSENLWLGGAGNFTLTTGSAVQSLGIGKNAGAAVTTGAQNLFIGYNAGSSITTGASNIIIGPYAMSSAASNSGNNMAIGLGALQFGGGQQNVANGNSALSGTTGNENVGIGYGAGAGLGIGYFNTFIGASSGTSNATVQYAGALGYQAGVGANNTFALGGTTTTNYMKFTIASSTANAMLDIRGVLNIDPLNVSSSTGSSLFTVRANGNVGIGTTTPANTESAGKVLDVYGSASSKIITTTSGVQTGIWSSNSTNLLQGNNFAGGIIGTYTNHPLQFVTNGYTRMTVNVDGTVSSPNSLTIGDSSGGAVVYQNAQSGWGDSFVIKRVDTTVGGIRMASNDADINIFTGSGTDRLTVTGAGNIGIGTTTPAERLVVNGNIDLVTPSASAGAIKSNGVDRLNWYGTDNLFMGGSTGPAGNYTLSGSNNIGIGRYNSSNVTSGANNVAIGQASLFSNSTGGNNVTIGGSAGYGITTGSNNLALGLSTLATSGVTGNNNIALGVNSLNVSQSGSANVGVGGNTLSLNTSGGYNTAIGYDAGNILTTGSYNTLIGNGANVSSNNLNYATAIGYNAIVGASNSLILGGTGASAVNVGIGTTTPAEQLSLTGNIAISQSTASAGVIYQNGNRLIHSFGTLNFFAGSNAGNLDSNLTGLGNTGVGNGALGTLTSGNFNMAIGRNALGNVTSGGSNVAMGNGALAFIQTNGGNTAIGDASMYGVTGDSNVAIGQGAGRNDSGGVHSGNTYIGNSAGYQGTVGLTNATAIGWNSKVDISNAFILGGTGGYAVNVGIGTTTPSKQLTTTGTVQFAGITGGTLIADAVGNVTASSDENLKNIEGNFTRGLEDILKINPISYHWKESTGYDTNNLYSGFSAQNIQIAIPEAVLTNSSGYLTLQDRPILAAAVNAIKELSSLFAKFENGIAYIKSLIVEKFTIGSSEKPSGITIFDEATGQPFCIKVLNGVMMNAPGTCDATAPPPAAPALVEISTNEVGTTIENPGEIPTTIEETSIDPLEKNIIGSSTPSVPLATSTASNVDKMSTSVVTTPPVPNPVSEPTPPVAPISEPVTVPQATVIPTSSPIETSSTE